MPVGINLADRVHTEEIVGSQVIPTLRGRVEEEEPAKESGKTQEYDLQR